MRKVFLIFLGAIAGAVVTLVTSQSRTWRNAPTLPKEERLKAVRKAELHSGLARALDANPDLGMAKSLSESAIPDVVYCPFPPTRDAGERGEVE
jgi:hypothetical protein